MKLRICLDTSPVIKIFPWTVSASCGVRELGQEDVRFI